MKRYHNRRVRQVWHQVVIPEVMSIDQARNWCRQHLGARYHYDGYRCLWFERMQDVDSFQRTVVWEILKS